MMTEKELTPTDIITQIGEYVEMEFDCVKKIEYAEGGEPFCFSMSMENGKVYIVSILPYIIHK